MVNWKNLSWENYHLIRQLEDIPNSEMECLLSKSVYLLLEEAFMDSSTYKYKLYKLQKEGKEIPFKTLEEFGPQHLCDLCTFTLIGSENYGYHILKITEKGQAQNCFFCITTDDGNPMGAVFQKGIEVPIFLVYDGTIEYETDEHLHLCQALNILYKSRKIKQGQTVEEWLKGNDPDIQYYQELVEAL